MIRLQHVSSGAIVVVPEEKSARLGAEWQPVVEHAPTRAKRK